MVFAVSRRDCDFHVSVFIAPSITSAWRPENSPTAKRSVSSDTPPAQPDRAQRAKTKFDPWKICNIHSEWELCVARLHENPSRCSAASRRRLSSSPNDHTGSSSSLSNHCTTPLFVGSPETAARPSRVMRVPFLRHQFSTSLRCLRCQRLRSSFERHTCGNNRTKRRKRGRKRERRG